MLKIWCWKSYIKNQTGYKIKVLRTNNGLEYCGVEFTQFEAAGVRKQRIQHNGTAERMNRTLVEMARCSLLEAKLPTKFWAEAIATAAHIRNRSLTRSLSDITRYEARFGKKPDVSHFKTFVQNETNSIRKLLNASLWGTQKSLKLIIYGIRKEDCDKSRC